MRLWVEKYASGHSLKFAMMYKPTDRDISAIYGYVLGMTLTTPHLICNWIGFSMDLVSSSQYDLFWSRF
jgi:hypothetical protein